MANLPRLRQEFPSVERFTYLYAGKLGPMHRLAPKALAKYTSDWETQGGADWVARWRADAAPLTESLAALLGVSARELSITTSTESAARCIPVLPEATVAYEAHPESTRPAAPEWLPALSKPKPLPLTTTQEPQGIIAALEAHRPQLLVLSHAAPLSGALRSDEELQRICAAARLTDTLVILDIEHTVGIVPLQLSALPLYAAVGSCARWLCGGPGSAFLWMNADTPQQTSRETPPPTAYLVAEITARLLSQLGAAQLREKSIKQTQRLIDGALARGFIVQTPRQPEQRGGTVSIQVPHAYAVFRALQERRYLLDYHPDAGLLASPHFYNEDHELDAFLSQLDDILDRRDYERFEKR